MSDDIFTQWKNERNRADARIARINADHAHTVAQIVQDDADNADRNADFFTKMTGTLFESVKVMKDNIATLQNRIAEKNKEIENLKERIDVLEAASGSLENQKNILIENLSKDSNLMDETNEIFRNGPIKGNKKNNLRKIFEKTFDNILSKKGYENPSNYRID